MMFPFNILDPLGIFGLNNSNSSYIRGYRVDYTSPISEPCPNCGGRTFRSVEDRGIALCTRCKKMLYVYTD